jgi:hypothetical protein
MKPVFSSRWGPLALLGGLALMVALPALLKVSGRLTRQQAYESLGWRFGSLPWIQQKIFAEANQDVDIAFLGSSFMWTDINPNYVQRQLSDRLKRPAEVFTLGWNWGGFDELYFVARDLLDHRRCRMLVVYEERQGGSEPHRAMYRMYRYGDNADAVAGLPVKDRAALYAGAILGAPRQLVSLLRPNEPEPAAHWEANSLLAAYGGADLVEHRGTMRIERNMDGTPFAAFTPPGGATAADALIYSPATAASFQPSPPRDNYQRHFLAELAKLCRERGTRLVLVHLPIYADPMSDKIPMMIDWPAGGPPPCDLIGIPPARMYAGMARDDIMRLYVNDLHFNANGQDYFTPLLTPALLDLYATPTSH